VRNDSEIGINTFCDVLREFNVDLVWVVFCLCHDAVITLTAKMMLLE
jgi:hypothetical protein